MNPFFSSIVLGALLLLQSAIQAGGGGTQRLTSLPSSGVPTVVQTCDYFVNYGDGPATCTLSGVGVGDAIVIGIESNVPITGTTVNGTTLTAVDSTSNVSGSYGIDYVYGNAAAGVATISVSMGSTGKTHIIAAEFSGIAANPLGGHGMTVCTTACYASYVNSPSFTQAANDVVWSICHDVYGETETAGISPSTATPINTISWGTSAILVEYFIQTSAGPAYGSCNGSAFSSEYILSLALKHA